MHDLLIKGGTVVDGTGEPGRTADVAITDGVVSEIGAHLDGARCCSTSGRKCRTARCART